MIAVHNTRGMHSAVRLFYFSIGSLNMAKFAAAAACKWRLPVLSIQTVFVDIRIKLESQSKKNGPPRVNINLRYKC